MLIKHLNSIIKSCNVTSGCLFELGKQKILTLPVSFHFFKTCFNMMLFVSSFSYLFTKFCHVVFLMR